VKKLAAELSVLVKDMEAASKEAGEYEAGQIQFALTLLAKASGEVASALDGLSKGIDPNAIQTLRGAQIHIAQAAEALDAEPPARVVSPIAYDAQTGLYILFGGDHYDYLTNDTWVFDPKAVKWMQRHPATAPEPRGDHTLAAAGDGKVTLSGGYTYTSATGYLSGQYGPVGGGAWTYDIAANAWTGEGAAHPPTRHVYREGVFLPGFFLRGEKPDAAKQVARLASLPVNTWVVMNPAIKPRLNRDWGTAVLDVDRDLILFWSGGHSAHGGTDVLQYHIATNRWELPFPIEFPLGQLYTGGQAYPAGFNFNGRPWMAGHTRRTYDYAPRLKKMVFVAPPGGDRNFYLYDPDIADWSGRAPRHPGMIYRNDYHSLNVCSTPEASYVWTGKGQIFTLDAEKMTWNPVKLQGKIPGPGADKQIMVYDSKRDRLLCSSAGWRAPDSGQFTEIDCKTWKVKTLTPENIELMKRSFSKREAVYHPEADLVLMAQTTPKGGHTIAYDCANNRWISLKIGGSVPYAKSDLQMGMRYDPQRKLVWVVNAGCQVWAMRLDVSTARALLEGEKRQGRKAQEEGLLGESTVAYAYGHSYNTQKYYQNIQGNQENIQEHQKMQRKAAVEKVKKTRVRMYDSIVDYAVKNAAEWIKGIDPKSGRILIEGKYSTMHQCICSVFLGLYELDHPRNPYKGDRKYLEAAWKIGEYFLGLMDKRGLVPLVKVDGSKWSPRGDTWSYYAVTEIYARTKNLMDKKQRALWDEKMKVVRKANDPQERVHMGSSGDNHYAWQSLTSYVDARSRGDKAAQKRLSDYFVKLAGFQRPDGWWIESTGPVMVYNLLYVQPLGIYYLLSGDNRVTPAIVRAGRFHSYFQYPDASLAALISGRITYREHRNFWGIGGLDLGVDAEPYMRRWVDSTAPLTRLSHNGFAALGLILLYADKVLAAEPLGQPRADWYPQRLAARRVTLGKWELLLSALTGESKSRWLTDRSVHLSVWHPRSGLIVGGTKSTADPRWANFTFGTKADDYCARSARLGPSQEKPSVHLYFTGGRKASIRVVEATDKALTIEFENRSEQNATAQLPLYLSHPKPISGKDAELKHPGGRKTQKWTAKQLGGELHHEGIRIGLPENATFTWPYDVHNPYHPDGKLWEYNSPNRQAMDRYRERYGLVSFPIAGGAKARIRLEPMEHSSNQDH
jgi:hypothetical protein